VLRGGFTAKSALAGGLGNVVCFALSGGSVLYATLADQFVGDALGYVLRGKNILHCRHNCSRRNDLDTRRAEGT